MNFGKAIITFIIGIVLSFVIGSLFSDSGVAVMTAVCYVGAIIVGLFYDGRK